MTVTNATMVLILTSDKSNDYRYRDNANDGIYDNEDEGDSGNNINAEDITTMATAAKTDGLSVDDNVYNGHSAVIPAAIPCCQPQERHRAYPTRRKRSETKGDLFFCPGCMCHI